MKAADVMTHRAVTVRYDASVAEAARLMLQYQISGLPVVDDTGRLSGIVTEGDFLRHIDAGAEQQRPRLLEFLLSPARLAGKYAHSHGRKVDEVMTRQVITVSEETPLDEIVRLMERHRIKRLPVVRDSRVIGIVSRANLLRRLARKSAEMTVGTPRDLEIREQIVDALVKQPWADRAPIDIDVRDGMVQIWGPVYDERVARGLRVVAENVPGVRGVEVTALPESGSTASKQPP
jgi:CBS domain-containing protein